MTRVVLPIAIVALAATASAFTIAENGKAKCVIIRNTASLSNRSPKPSDSGKPPNAVRAPKSAAPAGAEHSLRDLIHGFRSALHPWLLAGRPVGA